MGRGCVIIAAERITVAAGVCLGEEVVLRDHDHRFGCGLELTTSGFDSEPLTIHAGARVEAGASVLKGVSVGAHARISAGAVVTRNVQAHVTVAGVPARSVSVPLPNPADSG